MARMIDVDKLMKDLTCDFIGRPLHGNRKTSMAHIRAVILAQPTLTPPNEPTYPCDLCVYNPPSSLDGKPCTYCPATGCPPEIEENI